VDEPVPIELLWISPSKNIPCVDWAPKGRKAENGPIPETYPLQEMPTSNCSKRTEKNVLDSDGTLIVSHGMLTGGSAVTEFLAAMHENPACTFIWEPYL